MRHPDGIEVYLVSQTPAAEVGAKVKTFSFPELAEDIEVGDRYARSTCHVLAATDEFGFVIKFDSKFNVRDTLGVQVEYQFGAGQAIAQWYWYGAFRRSFVKDQQQLRIRPQMADRSAKFKWKAQDAYTKQVLTFDPKKQSNRYPASFGTFSVFLRLGKPKWVNDENGLYGLGVPSRGRNRVVEKSFKPLKSENGKLYIFEFLPRTLQGLLSEARKLAGPDYELPSDDNVAVEYIQKEFSLLEITAGFHAAQERTEKIRQKLHDDYVRSQEAMSTPALKRKTSSEVLIPGTLESSVKKVKRASSKKPKFCDCGLEHGPRRTPKKNRPQFSTNAESQSPSSREDDALTRDSSLPRQDLQDNIHGSGNINDGLRSNNNDLSDINDGGGNIKADGNNHEIKIAEIPTCNKCSGLKVAKRKRAKVERKWQEEQREDEETEGVRPELDPDDEEILPSGDATYTGLQSETLAVQSTAPLTPSPQTNETPSNDEPTTTVEPAGDEETPSSSTDAVSHEILRSGSVLVGNDLPSPKQQPDPMIDTNTGMLNMRTDQEIMQEAQGMETLRTESAPAGDVQASLKGQEFKRHLPPFNAAKTPVDQDIIDLCSDDEVKIEPAPAETKAFISKTKADKRREIEKRKIANEKRRIAIEDREIALDEETLDAMECK